LTGTGTQYGANNMAQTTSPLLFDRALIEVRRARAAALGPETFLIDRVADDLADRLAAVLRHFALAIDLGTPTGALRGALAASGRVDDIISLSRSTAALMAGGRRVIADEEALPLRDACVDLVVSGLSLQFVNDLPGTLIQVRRALKPDGLFIAALAGGETLTELRQALAEAETEVEGGLSPRVAPFVDVRELGGLLQRAGFALPVTDVDRIVVRYDSAFALMRDLRRMGAANALIERRRAPTRRATFMRMAEIYAARFADADRRIRATFEIIWLSGWAPGPTQQQPLKPGSAQRRLADALSSTEISTGEKAGR
jgi:SAM-dependent methyltransferase